MRLHREARPDERWGNCSFGKNKKKKIESIYKKSPTEADMYPEYWTHIYELG